MSIQTFQNFVNEELPKRISTNDESTEVKEGLIPVSTGVGLTTTFKSPEELNLTGDNVSEINVKYFNELPINDYKVNIGSDIDVDSIVKPVVINLTNGLIVEIVDFEVIGSELVLNPIDFEEIGEDPISVNFIYVDVKADSQYAVINLSEAPIVNGMVTLNRAVYDNLIFNNVLIHLMDGSVLETNIPTITAGGSIVDLTELIENELSGYNVISLSMSYLTKF